MLPLVLILGIALRLPLLGNGLWRDEGLTYADISAPTMHDMIGHIAMSETHPPLFFFLIRWWANVFGYGEAALKTFPLLWSIAAIVTTYLLARTCLSRSAALGAAFLIATSFQPIYYSTEVRPYAMAQCLAALCVSLYCRAIFSGSERSLWAWTASALVLVWTHYAGILLLACLAVATVLFRSDLRVRPERLVAAYALVVLGFLPWLPFFIGHVRAGTPWGVGFTWMQRPDALASRVYVALQGLGCFALGAPWIRGLWGEEVSDVGTMGAILILAVRCWKQRGERKPERLAFSFVLASLCASLLAILLLGYSLNRYLVPFSAFIIIAYAGLIDYVYTVLMENSKLPHAFARVVFFFAGILIVCGALISSVTAMGEAKSGIRMLVLQAQMLARNERVMWLVAPDYAAPTLNYYFKEGEHKVLPRPAIYGFARWESPEFFRISGSVAMWQEADLIEKTLERVDRLACRGFDRLAFVKPTHLDTWEIDRGQMRYSRVRSLEEGLRRRYSVIQEASYDGREEDASLVLFRLETNKLCLPKAFQSMGQRR
jgi:4-amino-4-deoxy-L-arabinose transferase-like glycosyltransferase